MSEEILNKLLEAAIDTKQQFGKMNERLDRIDGRLDRIEERLDSIESELGTVKVAVLDNSRKIKDHDVAIGQIQARM